MERVPAVAMGASSSWKKARAKEEKWMNSAGEKPQSTTEEILGIMGKASVNQEFLVELGTALRAAEKSQIELATFEKAREELDLCINSKLANLQAAVAAITELGTWAEERGNDCALQAVDEALPKLDDMAKRTLCEVAELRDAFAKRFPEEVCA